MSLNAEFYIGTKTSPRQEADERWQQLDYVRGIYVLTAIVSAARRTGLIPTIDKQRVLGDVDYKRNIDLTERAYYNKLGRDIVVASQHDTLPVDTIFTGIVETERTHREVVLQRLVANFDIKLGEGAVAYDDADDRIPPPAFNDELEILDKTILVRRDLYRERQSIELRLSTSSHLD